MLMWLLWGGSKSSKGWASDSRSIQTKVELLENRVISAIAGVGKDVVHISGETFNKIGSAFAFHDSHVSQAGNNILPVFTLNIADKDKLFILNNTIEPAFPAIIGSNDKIQFQLPTIQSVSLKTLTDPTKSEDANTNPPVYKDFSFTIRILGEMGLKGWLYTLGLRIRISVGRLHRLRILLMMLLQQAMG